MTHAPNYRSKNRARRRLPRRALFAERLYRCNQVGRNPIANGRRRPWPIGSSRSPEGAIAAVSNTKDQF